MGHRLIDSGFQRHGRAATVLPVSGNHHDSLGVVDTAAKRLRTESGEDDRVCCADARARQHGDDRFRNHRHVDGNAITGGDAEFEECVGRFADVVLQFGVGDVTPIPGFPFKSDRHLSAEAVLDVAIDAVVGDVQRSTGEPAGERCVTPVEDLVELSLPGEIASLLSPEGESIGGRLVVHLRGRIGLGREVRRRRKNTIFTEQVCQSVVTHACSFLGAVWWLRAHHLTKFEPSMRAE